MPLDAQALRLEIRKLYSQVATEPKKGYHFHTGPDYAAERLGYRWEDLATLPPTITASFAGAGNPLAMGLPLPGDTVVDIGAGSGTDTFLAARHVGPTGLVLAVEMTPAMLALGHLHVALAGLRQVEYLEGLAESLPLPDASVDDLRHIGVLIFYFLDQRVLGIVFGDLVQRIGVIDRVNRELGQGCARSDHASTNGRSDESACLLGRRLNFLHALIGRLGSLVHPLLKPEGLCN